MLHVMCVNIHVSHTTCVTLHRLVYHSMLIIVVPALIFCTTPYPCYSDPIEQVQCSASNGSSKGEPGCLSSPLLSPAPDRTIQLGGLDQPAACLSACSAVHGEDTLALAVHRQVLVEFETVHILCDTFSTNSYHTLSHIIP